MNYFNMVDELEGRIDRAYKNGEFEVARELEDFLHWIRMSWS